MKPEHNDSSLDDYAQITAFYDVITSKHYSLRPQDYQDKFMNWGYWSVDAASQREANVALMRLLLSSVRMPLGKTLDVACGLGAVSRYLVEETDASEVHGIDISAQRLSECRQLVPSAEFQQMDAASLAFPTNYFDTVICVEAAFHFKTRERFLLSAQRVLKPGGSLLLADVLWSRWTLLEKENYIGSPEEYANALRRLAFEEVRVTDVTSDTIVAYTQFWLSELTRRLLNGEMSEAQARSAALSRFARLAGARHYVIASCRKRLSTEKTWRQKGDEALFNLGIQMMLAG